MNFGLPNGLLATRRTKTQSSSHELNRGAEAPLSYWIIMNVNRYFTGIGSRSTPSDIMAIMTRVAKLLNDHYFVVRSGGAPGADTAFELGVHTGQIFLPWKGFNGNQSQLYISLDESYEIAAEFHPKWNSLSNAARKMMARNVHQVLGPYLQEPSEFVLCWTPDGAEVAEDTTVRTGGTGQAIRLASTLGIPVFNMKNTDWLNRWCALMKSEYNIDIDVFDIIM